jgi:O-antigen/teichoic acid export membrane protein
MPEQREPSRIAKFLKDAATYAVSGAATTFIGVVMVPIYTRVFSPDEYGALDLITSLVAFLVIFLLMGQPSAVGRFYIDARDARDARVSASTSGFFLLATCLLAAGAALPFHKQIAFLLHRETTYSTAVALAICSVPFTVQFRFLQNLLKWRQEPVRYAGLSIASLVIGLSVIIYCVVIRGWGVTGVYAATLTNSIIFSCLGFVLVRSSLALVFSTQRLRELLAFGMPLVPVAVAYYFITYSDRYFLSYFVGLETVGMYAIGVRVSMVLALLLNGFEMAIGPFVYSHYRDESAPATFARTFDYVSVAATFSVTALALFASDVVNIFATPDYLPGHNVVPLLAGGTAIYGLGAYFSVGIGISKRTIHRAWTAVLAAGLNVGLDFLVVPRLGMVGAAGATVVAFLTLAVLQMRISQGLYAVPYRFGRHAVMYATAAAVIITAFAVDLDRAGWELAPVKAGLAGLVVASAVAAGLLTRRELAYARRAAASLLHRSR